MSTNETISEAAILPSYWLDESENSFICSEAVINAKIQFITLALISDNHTFSLLS